MAKSGLLSAPWPARCLGNATATWFINGSNARTYELFLVDPRVTSELMGPPMWGYREHEGGYLDRPVKIDPNAAVNNKLVMMPGERFDVIIDFNDPAWLAANSNFSGQS